MKLHVAELRDEFGAKRERRDEELRQLNDFLDKQDRKRSARWDRYEERGWLESRNVGGQKRWYLVFAGNTVAEVRCMSARYRLEVFDGFEIGVIMKLFRQTLLFFRGEHRNRINRGNVRLQVCTRGQSVNGLHTFVH